MTIYLVQMCYLQVSQKNRWLTHFGLPRLLHHMLLKHDHSPVHLKATRLQSCILLRGFWHKSCSHIIVSYMNVKAQFYASKAACSKTSKKVTNDKISKSYREPNGQTKLQSCACGQVTCDSNTPLEEFYYCLTPLEEFYAFHHIFC